MGNTESSDFRLGRMKEVTIKEVIFEKDTIIIVSTLEAVQILKHYRDNAGTSTAGIFAVVANGVHSYIITGWPEPGSEKCSEGYETTLDNVKTPVGTCFRFLVKGVRISVLIANHWQYILEMWSPRFQGNEIILTKIQ
ncbi:Hypothetical protein POVR1_LOCUS533 [uncultured virus]|nr:Hypothetical protein POVR1_LOCUS533 [uncultured virus]